MNKEQLIKLFLMMNSAYPNFVADEIKLAMWAEFMGDYPFEQAQINLINHIQNSPFIPTVADITKASRDPNQYTDHLQLREETSVRLKEIGDWQKKALPPGSSRYA
ncbi:replicative helicase loader/inhibitor [Paenibacillus sp. GP183]|uniref:replicative helicase loader/inhibitor n=1 Tax=Paenibacillus sp. GP183 TaxID=1882751 RepID=UPI000894590A|nr:replicative helicase loader/inhibitor [Paenibacillus sp. GP183]SEC18624.1 Loader and inhibitor of phage G40P [Paenibacillus sp. GP183]